MAIVNGYATLAELKARLGITDTEDDTSLESVITAASRAVDVIKGRRFYTVEETRIYAPRFNWMVEIDDLVTLTSLKTDPAGDGTYTDTWAAADRRLAPYNALANGEPFTWIETTVSGAYRFPLASGGYNILINSEGRGGYPAQPRVQVIGAFGYSASTPAVIREWCILASMRIWGRKDLVHGISGSAELGTLQVVAALKSDGELNLLLSAIKKRPIV